MARVAAADRSLAPGQVAAAVDAAAGNGQALRSLAAALAGRTARDVLADGAPPGVGRLVGELIARGSAEFTAPACKSCGTTGRPLTRSSRGGVCPRCRNRLLAAACARCGEVKPVAGRTGAGEPVCERCRRHERGHRPCGTCGKTAPIAVRARGGRADVCVNCYQMPQAVCTVCGRRRPCNFAGSRQPGLQDVHAAGRERLRPLRPGPAGGRAVARGPGLRHLLYQRAAPPRRLHGLRSAAAADRAARSRRDHVRGLRRPAAHPSVRALRRRGQTVRERPVRTLQPARPGLGPGRRRSRSDPRAHRVAEAITAARNPYSALNWLRTGGAAAILAEVAAGRTALTHQALDAHPDRRAADYLRHMLTAGGVLPARDEALARVELWSREVLDAIERTRRPAARPGLPDLAGPAAPAPPVRDQPRPPHHHRRRPAPGPRRGRLPGLAPPAWPHPGLLRSRRRGDLAGHRPGRLRRPGLPGLGRRPQALPDPARSPARNAGPAPRPTPASDGNSFTACSTTRPSTSPTGPPAACCSCSASTCHGPPS